MLINLPKKHIVSAAERTANRVANRIAEKLERRFFLALSNINNALNPNQNKFAFAALPDMTWTVPNKTIPLSVDSQTLRISGGGFFSGKSPKLPNSGDGGSIGTGGGGGGGGFRAPPTDDGGWGYSGGSSSNNNDDGCGIWGGIIGVGMILLSGLFMKGCMDGLADWSKNYPN